MKVAAEKQRLAEDKAGQQNWRRWGPYLSERQWGRCARIIRPAAMLGIFSARPRPQSCISLERRRIAGFSDDMQHLCLSLAMWNGRDPILKERLFGLTNTEGNHGEDVKNFLLPRWNSESFLHEDAL